MSRLPSAIQLMNWPKYLKKFLLAGIILAPSLGVVVTQYVAQANRVIDFAASKSLAPTIYQKRIYDFI